MRTPDPPQPDSGGPGSGGVHEGWSVADAVACPVWALTWGVSHIGDRQREVAAAVAVEGVSRPDEDSPAQDLVCSPEAGRRRRRGRRRVPAVHRTGDADWSVRSYLHLEGGV
jgi:hypothetical protein